MESVNTNEEAVLYQEEANERKYWTQIPNIVFELGLDPYEVRVYCHIKKVCGSEGQCFQRQKVMAIHCCMSQAQVSRALDKLLEIGLLKVKKGSKVKHEPDRIIVVNVWDDNMKYFHKDNQRRLSEYSDGIPEDANRIFGDSGRIFGYSNRITLNKNSSLNNISKDKKEEEKRPPCSPPVGDAVTAQFSNLKPQTPDLKSDYLKAGERTSALKNVPPGAGEIEAKPRVVKAATQAAKSAAALKLEPPPAVMAVWQASGMTKCPDRVLWSKIVEALGDNPDTMKLKDCAEAWAMKGYKMKNLAWALEWYTKGIGYSSRFADNQPPAPVSRYKENLTETDPMTKMLLESGYFSNNKKQ